MASEEVTDKRKSKAALHLESRLERLIKEMDTMVDRLNDKRTQLLKDIEVRVYTFLTISYFICTVFLYDFLIALIDLCRLFLVYVLL